MNLQHFNPQQYRIPYQEEQKWKDYLKENGFVVLANYLPSPKCSQFVNSFWNIMEILSQGKLIKEKQETHSKDQNYPPLLHGGMIQYVGHSQSQWQLRKLCKPIFEKIWNSDNLKTSFDGFCFMNGARKYEARKNNAFLHTDQSPLKDYVWSYQGIMTLTDSGQNQGGFVCVPRSHKYHHKYFEEKGLLDYQKDWFKVPEEDKVKEPLCNDLKIDTQAGDFILFDSRTFHCNTVPTVNCLRVCTYICMLPAQSIEEKILQERKKAVKDLKTTSHHPGDGFRTFAEIPKEAEDKERFVELIKKASQFKMDKQIQAMI